MHPSINLMGRINSANSSADDWIVSLGAWYFPWCYSAGYREVEGVINSNARNGFIRFPKMDVLGYWKRTGLYIDL